MGYFTQAWSRSSTEAGIWEGDTPVSSILYIRGEVVKVMEPCEIARSMDEMTGPWNKRIAHKDWAESASHRARRTEITNDGAKARRITDWTSTGIWWLDPEKATDNFNHDRQKVVGQQEAFPFLAGPDNVLPDSFTMFSWDMGGALWKRLTSSKKSRSSILLIAAPQGVPNRVTSWLQEAIPQTPQGAPLGWCPQEHLIDLLYFYFLWQRVEFSEQSLLKT